MKQITYVYQERDGRVRDVTVTVGWPEFRRKMLALSSGCAECGEHRWLDLHHKDEDPSNNTPENLEVLCPNHHRSRHSADNTKETCLRCKRLFIATRRDINRDGHPQHCSIACRYEKVSRVCAEASCTETFDVGYKSPREFCSVSCRNRAMANRRWSK